MRNLLLTILITIGVASLCIAGVTYSAEIPKWQETLSEWSENDIEWNESDSESSENDIEWNESDSEKDVGSTQEIVDWWDEMIDSLGKESKAVYTEPDWDNMWVEIEDIGEDTYKISLFGIAKNIPITYTITKTKDGYYLESTIPGIESKTYVRNTDGKIGLSSQQPLKPKYLILQDKRTGKGTLAAEKSICWLATKSWFVGDVTDDWDGSKINYKANNDAWNNCTKPLSPKNVDLAWQNGWYKINIWGTTISGSPYFYTPQPDGKSSFQMRINWK